MTGASRDQYTAVATYAERVGPRCLFRRLSGASLLCIHGSYLAMQKPVRRVRAASDYCRPSNGQSVFVAHSRLAALTSQAPEGERGHDTISGRRAQAWTCEKASIPASGTRRRCRGARSRGRRRGRGTGRQTDRHAGTGGTGTAQNRTGAQIPPLGARGGFSPCHLPPARPCARIGVFRRFTQSARRKGRFQDMLSSLHNAH